MERQKNLLNLKRKKNITENKYIVCVLASCIFPVIKDRHQNEIKKFNKNKIKTEDISQHFSNT